MNLASRAVTDEWPSVQSQFLYNSNDMFRNDHLERDNYEAGPFSPVMSIDSPQEGISELFYHPQYHPVVESESKMYKPHKSANFFNEPQFSSLDTSNSNCPLTSVNPLNVTSHTHFSIANHSKRYSSFDNCGEKKFVSEIHINFKDPKLSDAELKPSSFNNTNCQSNCEASVKGGDRVPHQNGYHLSSFETFLAEQRSDNENLAKNNVLKSELRSMSPESSHRKSEYHHSEKFIFLGCDAQVSRSLSDRNNEETNNHSPTPYSKMPSKPLTKRSDHNNLSKLFSTKSVQTLRQMDCIFKKTCDASVETDRANDSKLKREINAKRERKSEALNKIKSHPEVRALSSDSRSEKESFMSGNSSEKKLQKNRLKNVVNLKRLNNKAVRKKEKHFVEENNQDTFTGSYSEAFSQSNELCESYLKERAGAVHKCDFSALKRISKKTELNKKTLLKNNFSTIMEHKQNWKGRSKKSAVEKKEIYKANDKSNKMCDPGRLHLVTKGDTDRHSLEIQCLLDNLNTRLQSTVNCHGKTSKTSNIKGQNNQFNNVGSFWDNPLNPETTRSLFLGRQVTPKLTDVDLQKSINPEIQAIFESLERSTQNSDNFDNLTRLNLKTSPPNIDLNMRNSNVLNIAMGDSHVSKMCTEGLGSVDNLHDARFPSNLKFQKSFDLSPYDELVKSHLNSSDRRIKSVAAKNGCRIVIDGPISMVDPSTTCQAIRNKITFRCIVAGSSKDRLDKCLNYLKETFPNTYLRLHNRNSVAMK